MLIFPELEEKKVVKKISEDVSIDYYFLDNKKVMELIKKEMAKQEEREAKEREALGLSKSTQLRQKNK